MARVKDLKGQTELMDFAEGAHRDLRAEDAAHIEALERVLLRFVQHLTGSERIVGGEIAALCATARGLLARSRV